MPTRVMIAPDPIVLPGDVPGDHGPTDPLVAAMIAAATRSLDGPTGWLGRCLGPQTLETSVSCWDDIETALYGPVIAVDSITYVDTAGATQVVSDTLWTLDGDQIYWGSTWSSPTTASRRNAIKVLYRAGYDGDDPISGGTGPVPDEAKAAIIEAVQQVILARSDTLGLRSVEVPDVETITYLDADKVSAIMRKSSMGMLAGLWVPRA